MAAIAAEARHILCPSIGSNVGWLRRVALPGALHQNITRRDGFIRIDSPFAGESEQQGLVADHVIKHAGEKARLLRRGPNSIDSKAGHIEKSRNSRRVAREKFECGNRQLNSACALGGLALYCSAMPAHVLSLGGNARARIARLPSVFEASPAEPSDQRRADGENQVKRSTRCHVVG